MNQQSTLSFNILRACLVSLMAFNANASAGDKKSDTCIGFGSNRRVRITHYTGKTYMEVQRLYEKQKRHNVLAEHALKAMMCKDRQVWKTHETAFLEDLTRIQWLDDYKVKLTFTGKKMTKHEVKEVPVWRVGGTCYIHGAKGPKYEGNLVEKLPGKRWKVTYLTEEYTADPENPLLLGTYETIVKTVDVDQADISLVCYKTEPADIIETQSTNDVCIEFSYANRNPGDMKFTKYLRTALCRGKLKRTKDNTYAYSEIQTEVSRLCAVVLAAKNGCGCKKCKRGRFSDHVKEAIKEAITEVTNSWNKRRRLASTSFQKLANALGCQ